MKHWTPKEDEVVTKFWDDGHTVVHIVRQLQETCQSTRSKSAVIGRVHRLGLPERGRKGNINDHNLKARIQARARRKARAEGPSLEPAAKDTRAAKIVAEDEKRTDLIPLTELTDTKCRFPLGEVGQPGFGFCGHEIEEGRIYCPRHRKITMRPMEPRKLRNWRAFA